MPTSYKLSRSFRSSQDSVSLYFLDVQLVLFNFFSFLLLPSFYPFYALLLVLYTDSYFFVITCFGLYRFDSLVLIPL